MARAFVFLFCLFITEKTLIYFVVSLCCVKVSLIAFVKITWDYLYFTGNIGMDHRFIRVFIAHTQYFVV